MSDALTVALEHTGGSAAVRGPWLVEQRAATDLLQTRYRPAIPAVLRLSAREPLNKLCFHRSGRLLY